MRRIIPALAALLFSASASAALSVVPPHAPMEFAFRDPAQHGGKLVLIQGKRDGSAPVASLCGELGERCDCVFYRSATDRSPKRSAISGMSIANNTVSCALQRVTENLHEFPLVQLRNRWNGVTSEILPIRTSLTLQEVVGPAFEAQKVVGIFRYSCERSFFEGEGVNSASISCLSGQHLGLISAKYDFYTYRSGSGTNFGTGDFPYSGPICSRNDFLRIQCTNGTPTLRYGFYAETQGVFQVGVQMTRAPEAAPGDSSPLVSLYGYAALPDSAGDCPPGLMKARQWQAQPASITQGSLGGNPPSNFLNQGNSLNNTVVEASQPANFEVKRMPNLTPCAANGDCTTATFGGVTVAQSVPYTALSPVVCVIPPALLRGLF